ncbi:MAG: diaminopimelate epimerase, partial [Deltaproteobacteria bacterium]|nr:diaminopimelate epimerase [Deltaproteobacteria bacterium]
AIRSRKVDSTRMVRKMCHRKLGIGADQLLVLTKSRKREADFKMRIFNADGSEAEMCGNGIRCLGRYIKEANYTQKREITIETLAGIRTVKVTSKTVLVDLGEPKLKGKEIPANLSGRIINRPLKIESRDFRITCLSLGNPHCIIFQENLETFDLDRFGPLLENHHLFPRRINVSFVNVTSTHELKMRVWERGVGETMACGTAAAAAVVASVLNGFTDRKVKVDLIGGRLDVEWDKNSNSVLLSGPAEIVFEGSYRL